ARLPPRHRDGDGREARPRSAVRARRARRRRERSEGDSALAAARPRRERDRPLPRGPAGGRMKHFLSTQGLSDSEISRILDRAAAFASGATSAALRGKSVGLLFFNPSLRTRTSMEIAVADLGGTSTTLDVGAGVWNMEYRDGAVMDGDEAEHVREGA